MAITQQAVKLRPNDLYNGGSSGLRTCWHKFEFDGAFDQVQHLIGSKVASGTPGTYKVQFAVTDAIAVDTINNAWVPMRAGVAYNDKSAFGWKDATFNGAASKQIGLAPSQSNNSVIHMSTDVMNLSSIPRADGKPGGILLVKVVQIDSAGQYTQGNSNASAWDAARGVQPWFREWFCNATSNVDGIANLATLPTGTPFNGDYVFPGTPIVTNTASSLPTDLLLFTGDSRKSAAYMANRFANPARMAAMSLSSAAHPISTVDAAGSGHTQSQYLALAMDHLNAGLRPTVIHIPAFSQNGFSTFENFKTANDNFMAAVRAMPGLSAVKFVFDTDYGVKGYPGDPREAFRLQCNAYARSLANGTTVFCFDSDPIITDYSVTSSTVAPMYAPYKVGGDDLHVGPYGLSALAYGAGSSSSLTQTYASAFGVSNVAVAPGAPAIGTATAGNAAASVSGTAPAATNGGAITGYRATSTPGGITATSATLPVNVTGLTAGTAYTFTLAAQNSAGYGPESFASNSVTPAAADTTAPIMTGSITVSAITSSGFTLSVDAATDDIGVTGYEYSIDGGTTYTVIANAARTVTVTGRPASTSHAVRMRAFDAAGNKATPLSATATTTASADTTAPVMVAPITVSAQTATGFTLAWPAATDAVGVASYEVDNGSGSYVNVGTARTLAVTGKAASTTYNVRVRALDAAGNTATPLTATATTTADDGAVSPPTFVRSTSRTIIVGEVPGSFDQDGRFWSLTNPKKPTGSIDPNSTIDITFDWTKVLADIDAGIADIQFDILGLTANGAYGEGAFATIFVSNATGAASITCRITTDSVPSRIEDRTVFLTVEQH